MTTKTKRAPKFGPIHATPAYTVKIRGEHGCTVTGSPDYVDAQIECYLSSRPAGVVDVFYSEHCAKCHGSGRYLHNRRTLTWKPCRTCNGAPEVHADELVRTVAA